MKHSRRVDLECTCDKNRIKKNWRDSKQWRLQETRTIVLKTKHLKIYCLENSLRPHDGNRIEREDNCSEDQVGDGHEDDQDCRWVPEHSGHCHIFISRLYGGWDLLSFLSEQRTKMVKTLRVDPTQAITEEAMPPISWWAAEIIEIPVSSLRWILISQIEMMQKKTGANKSHNSVKKYTRVFQPNGGKANGDSYPTRVLIIWYLQRLQVFS